MLHIPQDDVSVIIKKKKIENPLFAKYMFAFYLFNYVFRLVEIIFTWPTTATTVVTW